MNENELLNALGPLAPLYQDETVNEIMVDSPYRVHVERRADGGQLLQDIASPFKSSDDIRTVIAGGTASGKTTFANRVAELVPPDKRLVVVEAVHEMQVHHPRWKTTITCSSRCSGTTARPTGSNEPGQKRVGRANILTAHRTTENTSAAVSKRPNGGMT